MKNILIKDIPLLDRPRERFIKYGVNNLSNEELIAIILKTGSKTCSSMTLARQLLSKLKNIKDLKNITINNLTNINGVGKVKAIELIASIELGKRVFYYEDNNNFIVLNNSTKVFNYFKDILMYEEQEHFYAIYLYPQSRIISYKLLFKGTLNTSCVHPREIFKYAFLESAYSIIVIHNHPSGEVTPSAPDIELTNVLFEIGKLMGIPVVDHIIIGKTKYYSFYENMHK